MKGPDTKGCILNTGSRLAPEAGIRLLSSKSAFLRSLTYYGLHAPVVVDTPKLPFTITLSVPKGATISLAAEGTAIEGRLAAGYVFTGAGRR